LEGITFRALIVHFYSVGVYIVQTVWLATISKDVSSVDALLRDQNDAKHQYKIYSAEISRSGSLQKNSPVTDLLPLTVTP